MGVDIVTYRSRIGYFIPCPYNKKIICVQLDLSHALMKATGSVSFIAILLLIAGIESNPGPKTRRQQKQQKHSTSTARHQYECYVRITPVEKIQSIPKIRNTSSFYPTQSNEIEDNKMDYEMSTSRVEPGIPVNNYPEYSAEQTDSNIENISLCQPAPSNNFDTKMLCGDISDNSSESGINFSGQQRYSHLQNASSYRPPVSTHLGTTLGGDFSKGSIETGNGLGDFSREHRGSNVDMFTEQSDSNIDNIFSFHPPSPTLSGTKILSDEFPDSTFETYNAVKNIPGQHETDLDSTSDQQDTDLETLFLSYPSPSADFDDRPWSCEFSQSGLVTSTGDNSFSGPQTNQSIDNTPSIFHSPPQTHFDVKISKDDDNISVSSIENGNKSNTFSFNSLSSTDFGRHTTDDEMLTKSVEPRKSAHNLLRRRNRSNRRLKLKGHNSSSNTEGVSKEAYIDFRKTQMLAAFDNQNISKQILNDLEFLRNEGHDRTNEIIEEKELSLRTALKVPETKWLRSSDSETLDTMMYRFQSQLADLDEFIYKQQNKTEAKVLETASNGLALKGLFVSMDGSHFTAGIKQQMVEAPLDARFHPPDLVEVEEALKFQSESTLELFQRSVSSLGYTTARNIPALVTLPQRKNGDENVKYSSDILYTLFPTASCDLDLDSLRLTDKVLQNLQTIESLQRNYTSEEELQNECNRFFENFGSHVICGKLHFGGIYEWLATYKSPTGTPGETITPTLKDALNTFVSLSCSSFAFNVENYLHREQVDSQAVFSTTDDSSELSKTALRVVKIGGAPNINTLPLWRFSLMQRNCTWAVIDRGDIRLGLKGVWDLVKNHASDFRNVTNLSDLLHSAWKNITKIEEISFSSKDKERSDSGHIESWKMNKRIAAEPDFANDIDLPESNVSENHTIPGPNFENGVEFPDANVPENDIDHIQGGVLERSQHEEYEPNFENEPESLPEDTISELFPDSVEDGPLPMSTNVDINCKLGRNKKIDNLLLRINYWLNDPDLRNTCLSYLEKIVEIVEQVSMETGNDAFWIEAVRTQKCVSDFLSKIIDLKTLHKDTADFPLIRNNFKRILNPLGKAQFFERDKITNWIYCNSLYSLPCILTSKKFKSVSQFVSALEETFLPEVMAYYESEMSAEFQQNVDKFITGQIALSSHRLLTYLEKSLELYHYTFFRILLTKLSYSSNIDGFETLLNITRVEEFTKEALNEVIAYKIYTTQDLNKLHAFLIRLAAQYIIRDDGIENKEEFFEDLILKIRKRLGKEIRKSISRYAKHSPFNWLPLIVDMEKIMNGKIRELHENRSPVKELFDDFIPPETPETDWTSFSDAETESNYKSEVSNYKSEVSCHEVISVPDSDYKTLSEDCEVTSNFTTKKPSPGNVPTASMDYMTPSEGGSDAAVKSEEVGLEMISTLGLNDYYPAKISLQDVIVVRKEKEDHDISAGDIPWLILRKIVMLDFQGRDNVLAKYSTSDKASSIHSMDCSLDDIFKELEGKDCDGQSMHPTDVFLAIFWCCDHMLKQVLVHKMFICKLAVPLIYPKLEQDDVYLSLWPLRSVSIRNNGSEIPITKQKTKVVTFIRIKQPSYSKSKLMNDLINDSSHETFFTTDRFPRQTERLISNGYAEMAWCLSSDNSNEMSNFDDIVTFINLRGNALSHKVQYDFLTRITNVFVVLLDIFCLSDYMCRGYISDLFGNSNFNSPSIILLLTNKNSCNLKQVLEPFLTSMEPQVRRNIKFISTERLGRQRNAIDIKRDLRNTLSGFLDGKGENVIENWGAMKEEIDIFNDEYLECCLAGQKLAEKVLFSLSEENIEKTLTKSEIVPLQELWIKNSEFLKEQMRDSQNSTTSEENATQSKMLEIRERQVQICKNISPLMGQFISTLIDVVNSSELTSYFLHWLRVNLDERSRVIIPKLCEKYNVARAKFRDLRGQNASDNILGPLRQIVDKAERDISDAPFGLEHLFREVGQIYEALVYNEATLPPEATELAEQLPAAIAKLLIYGHPFKLMEGDIADISMTWVQAVIRYIKEIIGDQKLFCVSVLGIQSSGKSTLLNTMFGIEVPVSSGCCTNGIYMRLVPVSKLENEFDFDYVLVMDTEGLRAHGLPKQNLEWGKRLASLVIGMSDFTVVNLKGPAEDIKYVLQLTVFACLRLKIAYGTTRSRHSCLFLNQNKAHNAYGKTSCDRQKLLDELDALANEVSKQENIRDVYSFHQLIEFDDSEHIWNLPDVWLGDCAMAPANPAYSKRALELKDFILTSKKDCFLDITSTALHLEDLWKALLKDNFVFSFKSRLDAEGNMI